MTLLTFSLMGILILIVIAQSSTAEVKNVLLGENVLLQCNGIIDEHWNEKQVLSWEKDDTTIINIHFGKSEIDEKFPLKYKLIENMKLIILDMDLSDIGIYQCVISSAGSFSRGELVTFQVTVPDSPAIVHAKSGDHIRLDCAIAQSVKWKDLHWVKSNVTITRNSVVAMTQQSGSGAKYRLVDNSSLAIMDLNESDAGEYVCKLSITSPSSPDVTSNITRLFVTELEIDNCTVALGMNRCNCHVNGTTQRRLICRAFGFAQAPLITWTNQTGAKESRSEISFFSPIDLDVATGNLTFTCRARSVTSGSFEVNKSVCVLFNHDTVSTQSLSLLGRKGHVIIFIVIIIIIISVVTLYIVKTKVIPLVRQKRRRGYSIPGSAKEDMTTEQSDQLEEENHSKVMSLVREKTRRSYSIPGLAKEDPTTEQSDQPEEENGSKDKRRKNLTVYNDPIHGHIEIPRYCQLIIDTPEFQRLRYIKQLGATSYVYPTAGHSRFDHSLGVCHLAGIFANALRKNGCDITPIDVICLRIASLCHDLGHGPLSHLFEDIVPVDSDGNKWKHEEQSVVVFKHLIKTNQLGEQLQAFNIGPDEIKFICELILGRSEEPQQPLMKGNKYYLYQIVNNRRNGVDVDTWDYLARDSYFLGIKSAFDHHRVIPYASVYESPDLSSELCFRDKVASDLSHMFGTRRRLHYTSYQHRVSKIISVMFKDALLSSAEHLKFTGANGGKYSLLESVKDPKAFCQLNDGVIHLIMHSEEEGMKKAREILRRIHSRHLYYCIEISRANELMSITDEREIKKKLTVDKDDQATSIAHKIWHEENFDVQVTSYDYGKDSGKNPLTYIPFYRKSSDSREIDAFFLPDNELPADQPLLLEDVTVRIFIKYAQDGGLKKAVIEEAKNRFHNLCKSLFKKHAIPATPRKASKDSGIGKRLNKTFADKLNHFSDGDEIEDPRDTVSSC